MQATLANAVAVYDGQPCTTSLKMAEVFGKRHDLVLRAIRTLNAPAEFVARNFAGYTYIAANGKQNPAYQITRDGFTLLAMGFTGKEAMRFKVAYIEAFNAMARKLAAQGHALPVAADVADLRAQVGRLADAVKELLPAHRVVLRWQVMPNGFEPPTFEEVRGYCAARGNGVDADDFCRYYGRRNWTRGRGVPITDWREVVQAWEKNGVRGKSERKAVEK